MTPFGWIIMLLSVGGVSLFFTWCIIKVISNRQTSKHLHSPADIDTHDREP